MALTRKDFDSFARALGESFATDATVKAVADVLADRANRSLNGHSLFDRDRFGSAVAHYRRAERERNDDPRDLADDVYAVGVGIANVLPDDGFRTGILAVLTDAELTLRR